MRRCIIINLIVIIIIPILIFWIDYELHKKNHYLYVFNRIKLPQNTIVLVDRYIEHWYAFDIDDYVILQIHPKDSLNMIHQIKNSGYIIQNTYTPESKSAVQSLDIPINLKKWLINFNCLYNYVGYNKNEVICFGYIHELNWLFYYHLKL